MLLIEEGLLASRTVALDEVRVGQRSVPVQATGGIIDSGTTVLLVSDDDALAIHQASAPCLRLPLCGVRADGSLCDSADLRCARGCKGRDGGEEEWGREGVEGDFACHVKA